MKRLHHGSTVDYTWLGGLGFLGRCLEVAASHVAVGRPLLCGVARSQRSTYRGCEPAPMLASPDAYVWPARSPVEPRGQACCLQTVVMWTEPSEVRDDKRGER